MKMQVYILTIRIILNMIIRNRTTKFSGIRTG
jgi:hypothetical protein